MKFMKCYQNIYSISLLKTQHGTDMLAGQGGSQLWENVQKKQLDETDRFINCTSLCKQLFTLTCMCFNIQIHYFSELNIIVYHNYTDSNVCLFLEIMELESIASHLLATHSDACFGFFSFNKQKQNWRLERRLSIEECLLLFQKA